MVPTVYNHLITSYMSGANLTNSNKVHKRSELRSIYNTIIKINKTSPLYKVTLTKENQSFALGIKDTSLQLSETVNTLYSDLNNSVFDTVKAYAENESSASAYIVSDDNLHLPEAFQLKVTSLATKQENKSFWVPINSMSPASGNYSFTITNDDTSFSFQYKMKENATNEDTLNRLSDFINKASIGLFCSTKKREDNTIQLKLVSEETGTTGEPIFVLKDTKFPDDAPGLIEYYGLNQISKQAKNAQFEINGEQKESLSNQILLNKALQIDFLSPSESSSKIGYLPDSDLIFSKISNFCSQYNSIIDLANNYDSEQGTSQKLLHKLKKVAEPYLNELESCGITFDDTSKIKMDEFLSKQSIESKEINSLFSSSGYLYHVDKQLYSIVINPMEYVDKTIITYPNFLKPNVYQPYISSIYSGMIFNYYC